MNRTVTKFDIVKQVTAKDDIVILGPSHSGKSQLLKRLIHQVNPSKRSVQAIAGSREALDLFKTCFPAKCIEDASEGLSPNWGTDARLLIMDDVSSNREVELALLRAPPNQSKTKWATQQDLSLKEYHPKWLFIMRLPYRDSSFVKRLHKLVFSKDFSSLDDMKSLVDKYTRDFGSFVVDLTTNEYFHLPSVPITDNPSAISTPVIRSKL